MRIFISHATEDKADFVRPLAEALRQHYEVWYDEYELTLGDSLLKKINEGLASCDYGVVVLSNSFFLKKWPQAELDGLFAMETTTRKMILPIWKDVTVEEVRSFSPILAGRLGVSASEGVPKVISEIRRAIEVSNRTREISIVDSVIQKAKLLDQTLQERSNNEHLSRCEEGVAIVRTGFANCYTTMKAATDAVQMTSQVLKFGVAQSTNPQGELFIVRTNNSLALHVLLTGLGGNYTYETKLVGVIVKHSLQHFGQDRKASNLRELTFKPTFRLHNQLAWVDSSSRKALSTEELVSSLLESLMDEIHRQRQSQ